MRNDTDHPLPLGAPEHIRLYAIGDIHGRLDLLDALLERIRADLRADPPPRAEIVSLGDLVDRGPDSRGVLERLSAPPPDLPPITTIRGNHDAMMADFLDDVHAAALWLSNGGDDTLRSYGIDPPMPTAGQARMALTRDQLRAAMPDTHQAFLLGLPLSHRVGDILFVHAGIDPRKPLADQTPEDLMWIREPFLSWDAPMEVLVVHGHTPRKEVDRHGHRLGLDTGAGHGRGLTAGVIEGRRGRFLTVS